MRESQVVDVYLSLYRVLKLSIFLCSGIYQTSENNKLYQAFVVLNHNIHAHNFVSLGSGQTLN